jgi:uncharacterized protein (DUF305 family)
MGPARSTSFAAAVLLSVLLPVLTACGGSARGSAQPAPAQVSRYPHTEADVRFMSAMIGHHAQAVEMATLAPTHDAGPSVRRLAERLMRGQQDEIATMGQWLRDRGQPVPEGHHSAHGSHMPGMLTDAQMNELAAARGAEFDRLFLTFMIQHHKGAVAMVKELFGTPGAGQDDTVFKFASDVNVDQTTEIARMERMLSALPASRPSS